MLMYGNLCNWYANDHLTSTTQLSVVATRLFKELPQLQNDP